MCPYSGPVASPGRSHWSVRRQRRPLDSQGQVLGPPRRPSGRPLVVLGLRMCVFA
jgi:hypothetical protein